MMFEVNKIQRPIKLCPNKYSLAVTLVIYFGTKWLFNCLRFVNFFEYHFETRLLILLIWKPFCRALTCAQIMAYMDVVHDIIEHFSWLKTIHLQRYQDFGFIKSIVNFIIFNALTTCTYMYCKMPEYIQYYWLVVHSKLINVSQMSLNIRARILIFHTFCKQDCELFNQTTVFF